MKEFRMRFKATPLALATALVLSTSPAFAVDLMQSYVDARQNDPALSIAESQNAISKENVTQSRSVLLPQISGGIGANDTHSSGTLANNTTYSSSSSNSNINASLNQSIFNYGNYAGLSASKARAEQSDAELITANFALIIRVSEAYFNVLTAIDSLAAARAEERSVKRQLDNAEKRLEVGLAPITDVYDARARYNSAQASAILAGNTLYDAREALTEITNVRPDAIKGLPDDFQPKAMESLDTEIMVKNALEQNPEIAAREQALAAAEKDIQRAKSGHYPYLDGNVVYNENTLLNGDVGPFSTTDSNSTAINLRLSIPIFTGGLTQSQVREAVAQRDIAADQLEQAKRNVTRQIRNQDRNLEAGLAEVEARRLALISAKSALEANEVGFEVGTRTIIDVLLTQQQLFAAAREYSRARHTYLVNTLRLKQAAGVLQTSDIEAINRLLTNDAEAKLQQ
jgi:outer membrane protein